MMRLLYIACVCSALSGPTCIYAFSTHNQYRHTRGCTSPPRPPLTSTTTRFSLQKGPAVVASAQTSPIASTIDATKTLPSPATTPLNIFREYSNQRLRQADACDHVVVSADDESAATLTMIDFSDLINMATDVIDDMFSNEMIQQQQRRRDFCRRIQDTGGYCIVRLHDSDMAAVKHVNDMWNCIDSLFQNQEDDHANLLRGFTLADATATTKTANGESGYIHLQTQLNNNQLVPHGLESLVGMDGVAQAKNAFDLFSKLGKAFASVVYSGCTDKDSRHASALLDGLLNENDDQPYSGTYHRLCQYVPGNANMSGQTTYAKAAKTRPLLRSHCDWTLATPIPVSDIAGLEVYDPKAHCWIRIEQVVASKHEKQGSIAGERWNSRYVVVLTGFWLELLTQGKMPATVHRVVSDPTSNEQRKSAPFFMRPRESLFRQVDQAFNQQAADHDYSMDYQQSVDRIGDYLANEHPYNDRR